MSPKRHCYFICLSSGLATLYTTIRSNWSVKWVTGFVAAAKESYLAFATVSADPARYLNDAQSFVDYMRRRGTLSKLPPEDYSTQAFYDAQGELQQ